MLGNLREKSLKPLAGWLFGLVIALSAAHYAVFGPRMVKPLQHDCVIVRFALCERLVHWLAMASFLFLAATGIMFLLRIEPSGAMRTAHRFAGPLFVVSVCAMSIIWGRSALLTSCDRDWARGMGGYLWKSERCPAEKFNAGQKLFFWIFAVVCGAVISATGLVMSFGKGIAPSLTYTIHDAAALALIAGVIGHVYLSVFANPGTISGVLTGQVKRSWARHHHPDWLRTLDERGPRAADISREEIDIR